MQGNLTEVKEELQREINECYEQWRQKAVDEALALQDIDASGISEFLKQTAGGRVAIKWEDPRKEVKRGRVAAPSWSGACQWLQMRLEEVQRLLIIIESGLGDLHKSTQQEQQHGVKEQMH